MEKENVFGVGQKLTGRYVMIGYQEYIEKIKGYAFLDNASIGVSVSGMHQVGKSSLVMKVCENLTDEQKDKYMIIYVDLAKIVCPDKEQLMSKLLQKIEREIERNLKLRSAFLSSESCDGIKEQIDYLKKCVENEDVYRDEFGYLLQDLGKLYHIILIIDEFDTARVFHDYDNAFLRDLCTSVYNISLFLVSRSELKNIAEDNHNNSVLVAAVKFVNVKGFEDKDIQEFYQVLTERYDINLSDADREDLEFRAGIMPRIYSLFGHEIAEAKIKNREWSVQKIVAERENDVKVYYDEIKDRLKTDGIIEEICAVTNDMRYCVTDEMVNAKKSIGYLTEYDEDKYFSFSEYFVKYVKSLYDLVPNILAIEETHKAIKDMIVEQLRRFSVEPEDRKTYEKFIYYYGQNYNSQKTENFITSSNKRYEGDTNLIDVISLQECIDFFIEPLWDLCFKQYFDNAEYVRYRSMFNLFGYARNPYMHGNEDKQLGKSIKSDIGRKCREFRDKLEQTKNDVILEKFNLIPTEIQKILDFECEEIKEKQKLEDRLNGLIGKIGVFSGKLAKSKKNYSGNVQLDNGSTEAAIMQKELGINSAQDGKIDNLKVKLVKVHKPMKGYYVEPLNVEKGGLTVSLADKFQDIEI